MVFGRFLGGPQRAARGSNGWQVPVDVISGFAPARPISLHEELVTGEAVYREVSVFSIGAADAVESAERFGQFGCKSFTHCQPL